MDNFTILNMQAAAGLLTFYLAFRWYVFPRLGRLGIHEALVPMVLIHGLRYLGMVFMVDTQVYDAFPDDLAFTVGMWDYTTALLAIVTAIALRRRWAYAIPLVWFFNVFGFTDLLVAFPRVFGIGFYNYDIGTMWWAFVTIGVVNVISHVYIFSRLITHLKNRKHA
ncbi:hypothetical protein CLV84_0610 [Neolewinella xylanilytica]|uniref:FAR-17a/AIG1-like protein n=1 Tax=Neolewinella xylanilytica TaxID=1514080 RepID=A0A2S6I848_9BACT|nr:hypothetical protein [Neolewinella xylanilytica]PPK87662.1 hypothetical protein CLV84_0610 [Neolewinella xylanilytica]